MKLHSYALAVVVVALGVSLRLGLFASLAIAATVALASAAVDKALDRQRPR
jgi:hypothetical protein